VQIFAPNHSYDGLKAANDALSTNFDGKLTVENRYDFISLDDTKFEYQYVTYEGAKTRTISKGATSVKGVKPHQSATLDIPTNKNADALTITAKNSNNDEIFTWTFKIRNASRIEGGKSARTTTQETETEATIKAGDATYVFSKTNGRLMRVSIKGNDTEFGNGPEFFAYKRSDRSMDQFLNTDDKEAFEKRLQYTAYAEQGKFNRLEIGKGTNDTTIVTAIYDYASLQRAEWHIAPDGSARLIYTYIFNGVVDLMGVKFDLPETSVESKTWLGKGPYRVWKNRLHGPQLGIWQTDYNDPIPGESFTYPEFKGYFAGVQWMNIHTKNATIRIEPSNDTTDFVGVYQPRDGRDNLLYQLPETGISIMQVIPAVRNKVNSTDLNGPSAQAVWANGAYTGEIRITFSAK
jgi:hypothetical protein